jgi:hypothetical protein
VRLRPEHDKIVIPEGGGRFKTMMQSDLAAGYMLVIYTAREVHRKLPLRQGDAVAVFTRLALIDAGRRDAPGCFPRHDVLSRSPIAGSSRG